VMIVIPVTILLTLFAARLMGYTLNRVSHVTAVPLCVSDEQTLARWESRPTLDQTDILIPELVDDCWAPFEKAASARGLTLHRTLPALLGLAEPRWHHHPLCVDAAGRRLAKRHDALSIRTLREAGVAPAEVFARAEAALAGNAPAGAA